MAELVAVLDPLYALRDVAPSPELDPVAAVKLAELAGAEAVRVSAERPEADLVDLRRVARRLELAIEASPAGLKSALEVRPDRVLLLGAPAAPTLRPLEEAGLPVFVRVQPDLDAVKAAHTAGIAGVEIDTHTLVDLPPADLQRGLERVGDASRLAAKLRMPVSLSGGLDTRSVGLFAERVQALTQVAVGRGLVARALLVGLERAVADLRARLP